MREAASATEGAPAGSASRKRGVVNGLSARGANALGIERERGGDTDVRAAIVTDGTRTRSSRARNGDSAHVGFDAHASESHVKSSQVKSENLETFH